MLLHLAWNLESRPTVHVFHTHSLDFSGYNMTSESRANAANSSLTYHRIIEAFKFGFSWRARLGDPAFNNDTNEVGK